ncbi:MAG: hypothetical protein A2W19_11105 [Spirochaetes bacterium RBG_16_49_21]|nr:MAG: hypothetical protein A2W19_11105 [Spirochaetes bacterium RBG_16_49_21]
MRINSSVLRKLYKDKGLLLKDLLEKSGVSKAAYYNVLYKSRLLPGSIYDLAQVLDAKPSIFLEEENPEEKKIMKVLQTTEEIMDECPGLDRDNVRHTLILLNETPIERLRRGLTRGRRGYFYK